MLTATGYRYDSASNRYFKLTPAELKAAASASSSSREDKFRASQQKIDQKQQRKRRGTRSEDAPGFSQPASGSSKKRRGSHANVVKGGKAPGQAIKAAERRPRRSKRAAPSSSTCLRDSLASSSAHRVPRTRDDFRQCVGSVKSSRADVLIS